LPEKFPRLLEFSDVTDVCDQPLMAHPFSASKLSSVCRIMTFHD
jgi:hypothetical protein